MDIHKVVIEYSYVSGMCRVCIAYVSGMYRNFRQSYDIFFICKYQTRNRTKKIATYAEHKWRRGRAACFRVFRVSALRACFRVAHQIFRLMPAKKVRGVAGP